METKDISMCSGCRRLEDNSKRGARAIFFLKFLYILIIVGLVLANISIELPKHLPPEAAEGMDKETILQLYHAVRRIYYLEIANIILMFGAIVTSVIIAGVFLVYLILWLYRAIKNLRCLTKTTFSPKAAIISTVLSALIGHIIDVLILWDIARQQQKLLDERGIQYTPVSKRDLTIFFVFLILVNVLLYIEIAVSWPGCFAACAAIIGLILSWLRVLRPCVEQGNMLYQLQQEIINHTKG